MKKHKKDLLLIVIILAIAAVGFTVNYYIQKKPAAQLEITVDGKVVELLDLNKDTEMTIDGWNGGTNHLIIQDGIAWVDEATCPDKVCIHQGKVTMNRQMIVCLPNRLVISVSGSDAPEVDGITG